jgi:hypothetical protein
MGTHPKCVQTPNYSITIWPGKGAEEQLTNHDQPFGLLDTVLIPLGIP